MRVLIIILFLVMEFFCSEANALESSGDSISKSTFQRFQLGTSSEMFYFDRNSTRKLIVRLPITFVTAVSPRKKIVLNTAISLFLKKGYEEFLYRHPTLDFRFSYWYKIFKSKGFYFSTSLNYRISAQGSRLDKIPIFNLIPKPDELRRYANFYPTHGIGYERKLGSNIKLFAVWEPLGGPFSFGKVISPKGLLPNRIEAPILGFLPMNFFINLTFAL